MRQLTANLLVKVMHEDVYDTISQEMRANDPNGLMLSSTDLRSKVARDALARAQDRAQAEGKIRISWKRRQKRFLNGSTPDSAVEENSTEEALDPSVPAELQALEAHTRHSGAAWVATPGMATTRPRFRRSDALGSVLGTMVRAHGWDQPTKMGSVMAKWQMIVGEQVASHCVVESFEDKKLVIRCDSTAWMNQLQILLPHIERRIEEEVGADVVQQTIIRGPQAPSWKKGKWSVRGRGPRDTYG